MLGPDVPTLTTGVFLSTSCTRTGEVDALCDPSPLYTPVMLCSATARFDVVVNVATPLLMVPVPNVVAPSMTVTLPVAPPASVAVNVTGCEYVDGFSDEASTIVA